LKWKVELKVARRKKWRITIISVVHSVQSVFNFTHNHRTGEKNDLLPEEAETAAETRKRIDFTFLLRA
jgi:hypothetical protein